MVGTPEMSSNYRKESFWIAFALQSTWTNFALKYLWNNKIMFFNQRAQILSEQYERFQARNSTLRNRFYAFHGKLNASLCQKHK